MPKEAHKVVVIGHRNPDTDSICSAIAYAELKNRTSTLVCEPRRAGKMNQETEFVLKKFGVTPPRMCTDVNPKIRDVDYREMPGIPGSTSLRRAWKIMRDQQIDTLSITSADNELEGIITVKDLATANMDVFDTAVLAKSRTSYKNILETLNGTMVVGNADAVCTTGHIKIGTATPEMLESSMEKGDIVILTNRYESQLCAIEKEASLIIICNGAKVGRTIQHIAAETGEDKFLAFRRGENDLFGSSVYFKSTNGNVIQDSKRRGLTVRAVFNIFTIGEYFRGVGVVAERGVERNVALEGNVREDDFRSGHAFIPSTLKLAEEVGEILLRHRDVVGEKENGTFREGDLVGTFGERIGGRLAVFSGGRLENLPLRSVQFAVNRKRPEPNLRQRSETRTYPWPRAYRSQ